MVKNTAQRKVVIEVLQENKTHPTAKDIIRAASKKLPYITKPTVYNILNWMAKEGKLQTLTIDENSLRFDPDPKPHPHLFCILCKKVLDIDVPLPQELIKKVSNKYLAKSIELNIKGICPSCKKKGGKNENRTKS